MSLRNSDKLRLPKGNTEDEMVEWHHRHDGHEFEYDLGESVEMALKREVQEELSITNFTPELLSTYVFESDREKELIFAYKTIYEDEIIPSEELEEGRFWSLEEVRNNLGKGVFTPNFESEFQKLKF